MEEAGVRPPGIVPGAFGGVPGAEGTQSPVPSIPSTPAWELRAGQDHPTPVFLHDACFAPGAESARRRPPCAPAAPGTRRGPPRCGRATRWPRALTQVVGSPSRLARAQTQPATRPLPAHARSRVPCRAPLGHASDPDLSGRRYVPTPPPPPHPPTPPRSRPGRARSARRILGDAPRPQEWTLKM